MDDISDSVYSDDLHPANKMLNSLEILVEEGYRKNASEICSVLSEFSALNYPIRILARIFCKTADVAKLAGAQSYIIYGCDSYYLRLNFWIPSANRHALVSDRFKKYFSIGVLHNHAFDFFTVGVLGDGYFTEIYNANIDSINTTMCVGDHISLTDTSKFKLQKSISLFFPKFIQFHTQYEPTNMSASLNLIPRNMDHINSSEGTQYILSNETHMIDKIFRST
jgi:hypothetical protein